MTSERLGRSQPLSRRLIDEHRWLWATEVSRGVTGSRVTQRGVLTSGEPAAATHRSSFDSEPMKILFITSAHNSMSQRAQVELESMGHRVHVALALGPDAQREAVRRAQPDLIVCPMLKQRVPADVWQRTKTLIVHPGIRGDRGPSSLDWAIAEGEALWGVTIVEAHEEMDAGDIWAYREFPVRRAAKSSLYRFEVIESAMAALHEAVVRFDEQSRPPTPLDYANPFVRGRLRPAMKQKDRTFSWAAPTTAVLHTLHAADSSPGVRVELFGQRWFLYDACAEDQLRGEPGELLATRDGAVCVATGDGAVWVGHIKRARDDGRRFVKLPAARALGAHLSTVPEVPVDLMAAAHRQTYRQLWYEEQGEVGYLHFEHYNGAMGTEQCRRLSEAIRWAGRRDTHVLVLMGGQEFWSNGIHLNVIEAADAASDESWENINAINDVVREILDVTDKLVVSAMHGNAGAGGVTLALAADRVVAREGVVLNPHYKSMGGLYGSEYWTYLLPRRVGPELARTLTESLHPVGATEATAIGLIDATLPGMFDTFRTQVRRYAEALAQQPGLSRALGLKRWSRRRDERRRPLQQFRDDELEQMRRCFYDDDAYHQARRAFVYKSSPVATPPHVAMPRRPWPAVVRAALGSFPGVNADAAE